MPAWDRQTPWRQGHALTSEAAITLGLIQRKDATNLLVVVISHDCDLTQDPGVEPCVEMIMGNRTPAADGNFTHGKNPRRLHLPVQENAAVVHLDLLARDKCLVPKEALAAHMPNDNVMLRPGDRSVLQRWLAARYRQSAFPDEFEHRLRETGIHKRIAKILEPLGTNLIAVFFDVDRGEQIERKDVREPYSLIINLLYSTEHDPDVAFKAAEDAAAQISAAFREACFDSAKKNWRLIELTGCEPISDQVMTYWDAMQLTKWNVDYLSLRTEPEKAPMLSE
jgi:hypothetical protein